MPSEMPASREQLYPSIRQHIDQLTTQFDKIEQRHQEASVKFAEWLFANYREGQPLGVIIVCTGNTRRSMLGATMGNIAAAYYGLPDLRFFSGGTEPQAFNPRTIATLKEIGVEIAPTGEEAPRGEGGTPNPIYRVSWGDGLEILEFSKKYNDLANPQQNFAAILVCTEADAACPQVVGASLRLPVPYHDPKAFDDTAEEKLRYAERRDDIGRFMLSTMAKRRS